MIRLVILDMDGVVFQGRNFWLELHQAMGTVDEAMVLWRELAEVDYPEMSRRTAALWKGRSAERYFKLIQERRYTKDVEHIFAFAANRGVRTAIVSSGAYHLALRAREKFGVDAIRANRLGVDENRRFDGTLDLQVDNNHKDAAARDVQRVLGVKPSQTAVVGDGANDVPMTKLAAVNIGYRVQGKITRANFGTHIDVGSIAAAIGAINNQQHSGLPFLRHTG